MEIRWEREEDESEFHFSRGFWGGLAVLIAPSLILRFTLSLVSGEPMQPIVESHVNQTVRNVMQITK